MKKLFSDHSCLKTVYTVFLETFNISPPLSNQASSLASSEQMWLIWARTMRTPSATSAASPPTRKKRASPAACTPTTAWTNRTSRAGCWWTWTTRMQRRTFSCCLSWHEQSNLTRYEDCYKIPKQAKLDLFLSFDVMFVLWYKVRGCDNSLLSNGLSKVPISWSCSGAAHHAECELFRQF